MTAGIVKTLNIRKFATKPSDVLRTLSLHSKQVGAAQRLYVGWCFFICYTNRSA